MNRPWLSVIVGWRRLLPFALLCSSGAHGQTLKEVGKFDLPGPGGKRFDYLTIDEEDQYLISAHMLQHLLLFAVALCASARTSNQESKRTYSNSFAGMHWCVA